MGIIILSHEPPRDITFSIAKAFCEFKKYDGIEDMPARTSAYIKQWTSKADGTLQVHWEYDDQASTELLSELLMQRFELRLEPYHNRPTSTVPKAFGMSAKTAYAAALKTGPYASWFRQGEQQQQSDVEVPFTSGGHDGVQTWVRRPPQFVTEDWRPGGRERLTIRSGPRGLSPSEYNTLEKLLFRVTLPMNLVDHLVHTPALPISTRIPPNSHCISAHAAWHAGPLLQ